MAKGKGGGGGGAGTNFLITVTLDQLEQLRQLRTEIESLFKTLNQEIELKIGMNGSSLAKLQKFIDDLGKSGGALDSATGAGRRRRRDPGRGGAADNTAISSKGVEVSGQNVIIEAKNTAHVDAKATKIATGEVFVDGSTAEVEVEGIRLVSGKPIKLAGVVEVEGIEGTASNTGGRKRDPGRLNAADRSALVNAVTASFAEALGQAVAKGRGKGGEKESQPAVSMDAAAMREVYSALGQAQINQTKLVATTMEAIAKGTAQTLVELAKYVEGAVPGQRGRTRDPGRGKKGDSSEPKTERISTAQMNRSVASLKRTVETVKDTAASGSATFRDLNRSLNSLNNRITRLAEQIAGIEVPNVGGGRRRRDPARGSSSAPASATTAASTQADAQLTQEEQAARKAHEAALKAARQRAKNAEAALKEMAEARKVLDAYTTDPNSGAHRGVRVAEDSTTESFPERINPKDKKFQSALRSTIKGMAEEKRKAVEKLLAEQGENEEFLQLLVDRMANDFDSLLKQAENEVTESRAALKTLGEKPPPRAKLPRTRTQRVGSGGTVTTETTPGVAAGVSGSVGFAFDPAPLKSVFADVSEMLKTSIEAAAKTFKIAMDSIPKEITVRYGEGGAPAGSGPSVAPGTAVMVSQAPKLNRQQRANKRKLDSAFNKYGHFVLDLSEDVYTNATLGDLNAADGGNTKGAGDDEALKRHFETAAGKKRRTIPALLRGIGDAERDPVMDALYEKVMKEGTAKLTASEKEQWKFIDNFIKSEQERLGFTPEKLAERFGLTAAAPAPAPVAAAPRPAAPMFTSPSSASFAHSAGYTFTLGSQPAVAPGATSVAGAVKTAKETVAQAEAAQAALNVEEEKLQRELARFEEIVSGLGSAEHRAAFNAAPDEVKSLIGSHLAGNDEAAKALYSEPLAYLQRATFAASGRNITERRAQELAFNMAHHGSDRDLNYTADERAINEAAKDARLAKLGLTRDDLAMWRQRHLAAKNPGAGGLLDFIERRTKASARSKEYNARKKAEELADWTNNLPPYLKDAIRQATIGGNVALPFDLDFKPAEPGSRARALARGGRANLFASLYPITRASLMRERAGLVGAVNTSITRNDITGQIRPDDEVIGDWYARAKRGELDLSPEEEQSLEGFDPSTASPEAKSRVRRMSEAAAKRKIGLIDKQLNEMAGMMEQGGNPLYDTSTGKIAGRYIEARRDIVKYMFDEISEAVTAIAEVRQAIASHGKSGMSMEALRQELHRLVDGNKVLADLFRDEKTGAVDIDKLLPTEGFDFRTRAHARFATAEAGLQMHLPDDVRRAGMAQLFAQARDKNATAEQRAAAREALRAAGTQISAEGDPRASGANRMAFFGWEKRWRELQEIEKTPQEVLAARMADEHLNDASLTMSGLREYLEAAFRANTVFKAKGIGHAPAITPFEYLQGLGNRKERGDFERWQKQELEGKNPNWFFREYGDEEMQSITAARLRAANTLSTNRNPVTGETLTERERDMWEGELRRRETQFRRRGQYFSGREEYEFLGSQMHHAQSMLANNRDVDGLELTPEGRRRAEASLARALVGRSQFAFTNLPGQTHISQYNDPDELRRLAAMEAAVAASPAGNVPVDGMAEAQISRSIEARRDRFQQQRILPGVNRLSTVENTQREALVDAIKEWRIANRVQIGTYHDQGKKEVPVYDYPEPTFDVVERLRSESAVGHSIPLPRELRAAAEHRRISYEAGRRGDLGSALYRLALARSAQTGEAMPAISATPARPFEHLIKPVIAQPTAIKVAEELEMHGVDPRTATFAGGGGGSLPPVPPVASAAGGAEDDPDKIKRLEQALRDLNGVSLKDINEQITILGQSLKSMTNALHEMKKDGVLKKIIGSQAQQWYTYQMLMGRTPEQVEARKNAEAEARRGRIQKNDQRKMIMSLGGEDLRYYGSLSDPQEREKFLAHVTALRLNEWIDRRDMPKGGAPKTPDEEKEAARRAEAERKLRLAAAQATGRLHSQAESAGTSSLVSAVMGASEHSQSHYFLDPADPDKAMKRMREIRDQMVRAMKKRDEAAAALTEITAKYGEGTPEHERAQNAFLRANNNYDSQTRFFTAALGRGVDLHSGTFGKKYDDKLQSLEDVRRKRIEMENLLPQLRGVMDRVLNPVDVVNEKGERVRSARQDRRAATEEYTDIRAQMKALGLTADNNTNLLPFAEQYVRSLRAGEEQRRMEMAEMLGGPPGAGPKKRNRREIVERFPTQRGVMMDELLQSTGSLAEYQLPKDVSRGGWQRYLFNRPDRPWHDDMRARAIRAGEMDDQLNRVNSARTQFARLSEKARLEGLGNGGVVSDATARQVMESRKLADSAASAVVNAVERGISDAPRLFASFQPQVAKIRGIGSERERLQGLMVDYTRSERKLQRYDQLTPQELLHWTDAHAKAKDALKAEGFEGIDPLKAKIKELATEERNATNALVERTLKQKAALTSDKEGTLAVDRLAGKLKTLSTYMFAGGILWGSWMKVSQAVSEVVNLEKEMAEIQGVFVNKTMTERLRIEEATLRAARQYALSVREVAQMERTFAQTGMGAGETTRYTDAALRGVRGAGLDPQQSADLLIATRALTNGRVSPHDIIERISKIEAREPVTARDLAAGVQRAGAVAMQLQPNSMGGMDALDAVIGMQTEIIKQTRQTGEAAATSIRFMLARLAAPDIQSKLQNEFGIKLAANAAGTQLRPVTDILESIAQKYNDLNNANASERANDLLVTFAGARQVNSAAALFKDWDKVMKVARDSSTAFGESQRRLAIQMDTLAFKVQEANSAFIEFVQGFLRNSGIMFLTKKVVGASAGVLQFASGEAMEPGLARDLMPSASGIAGGLGVLGAGAGLKALYNPLARRAVNVGAKTATKVSADVAAMAAAKLGQKAAAEVTSEAAGVAVTRFGMNLARGSVLLGEFLTPLGWVIAALSAFAGAIALATYWERKKQEERDKFGFKDIDIAQVRDTEEFKAYRQRAMNLGVSSGFLRDAVVEANQYAMQMASAKTGISQDELFTDDDKKRKYDARVAGTMEEAYLQRLRELVPQLAAVGDKSEQLATAMQLLKETAIQTSAVSGIRTSELNEQLEGSIKEVGEAFTEAARKDIPVFTNSFQIMKRMVLTNNPMEAFGGAGASHYGMAYNKTVADFLDSNRPDEVRDDITDVMKHIFVGSDAITNSFLKFSYNNTTILEEVSKQVEKGGKTLGQALDSVTKDVLDYTASEKATLQTAEAAIAPYVYSDGSNREELLSKQLGTMGAAGQAVITRRAQIGRFDDELYAGMRARWEYEKRVEDTKNTQGGLYGGGEAGGAEAMKRIMSAWERGMERMMTDFRKEGRSAEAAQIERAQIALQKMQNRPEFLATLANGAKGAVKDRLLEVLIRYMTSRVEISGASSSLYRAGIGSDVPSETRNATVQALRSWHGAQAQISGDLMRAAAKLGQLEDFRDSIQRTLSTNLVGDADTPEARVLAQKDAEAVARLIPTADDKTKESLNKQMSALSSMLQDIAGNKELFEYLKPEQRKQITTVLEMKDGPEKLAAMLLSFSSIRDALETIATREEKIVRLREEALKRVEAAARFEEQIAQLRMENAQGIINARIGVAAAMNPQDALAPYGLRQQQIALQYSFDLEQAHRKEMAERKKLAEEVSQRRVKEGSQEYINRANEIERAKLTDLEIANRRKLNRELELSLQTVGDLIARNSSRMEQDVQSSVQGFKKLAGSYEAVRGAQKRDAGGQRHLADALIGPLAETIQNRISENTTELLFGKDGLLGGMLYNLFDTGTMTPLEMTREGTRLGVLDALGTGFSQKLAGLFEHTANAGDIFSGSTSDTEVAFRKLVDVEPVHAALGNLTAAADAAADALNNIVTAVPSAKDDKAPTETPEGAQPTTTSSTAQMPKNAVGKMVRLAPVIVTARPVAEIAAGAPGAGLDPDADALYQSYSKKPGSQLGGHPEIARMVYNAALKNGVDPKVAFALVHSESAFNPNARSKVGALGLGQLMPSSFSGAAKMTPEENVNQSMAYLKELLDQNGGNLDMALASYNWGPGNVRKRGLGKAPAETRAYIAKINRLVGESPALPSTQFAENKGTSPGSGDVPLGVGFAAFGLPLLLGGGAGAGPTPRLGANFLYQYSGAARNPNALSQPSAMSVGFPVLTAMGAADRAASLEKAFKGAETISGTTLSGNTFSGNVANLTAEDMMKLKSFSGLKADGTAVNFSPLEMKQLGANLSFKDKLKANWQANKGQLAGQLGAFAGNMGGGAIAHNMNGGYNYGDMGASLGTAIGSMAIPIPGVGGLVGGLLGGLVGGLFKKKKPKEDPVYTQLEKIERNTRENVEAIENQTRRFYELDNRMLNVPADFTVPKYRPLGVGNGSAQLNGGDTTYNVTVNVDAKNQTDPDAIGRAVSDALRRELRSGGSFQTTRR